MPVEPQMHGLWPNWAVKAGFELPIPPFTNDLQKAFYAFLLVNSPNSDFLHWFEFIFSRRSKDAKWEVILAIDPSHGTHEIEPILKAFEKMQSNFSGVLKVRLLTPAKLNNSTPRFNFAYLKSDENSSISIGTSPSFGLGLGKESTGNLNIWTSPDVYNSNDIRQIALGYWSIAAELTKNRCEIPLLEPCRGNQEGYIQWQAYEALLSDANDLFAQSPTIQDLPITEDGGFIEEILIKPGEGSSGILEHTTRIPLAAKLIQSLYERGYLVSVQQIVKPLSVPIPPSLFGQRSEEQVGALKYKQEFKIDLFSDDLTAKEVERLRKGIGELVKLFSFSFGHGKYWVPHRARQPLENAIKDLSAKSKNFLNIALGGNLDSFLENRRTAIHRDCSEFFRRFYPGAAMPTDVADRVIDLLRKRVEKAEKEGLSPKITSTSITFRFEESEHTDPWSDALLLLSDIFKLPREMLTDSFAPRRLKPLDITVFNFLGAMDVFEDDLLHNITQEDIESPFLKDRARRELILAHRILDSHHSTQEKCQRLISIMKNKFDEQQVGESFSTIPKSKSLVGIKSK